MATKLYVLHDADGKVIAASESKNPPHPKNLVGAKVTEFEVPAKFEGKRMHEYMPHLKLDLKTGQLRGK